MKLILLHGSFQDALLKKVSQIKMGFDSLSITEISDAGLGFNLSSQSLFSGKRLVVFDNPDIKVIEKAALEKDPNLTVVIKFSKSLEKSSPVLKKVSETGGEILAFDESGQTAIFPFLDMLGNLSHKSIAEFEKNYQDFGGQYLLVMLSYFLRRMVAKTKPGSDFMRAKIEKQKRNFDLKRIEELYLEIIETDFKIKQGLLEEKLGTTLLVSKILS